MRGQEGGQVDTETMHLIGETRTHASQGWPAALRNAEQKLQAYRSLLRTVHIPKPAQPLAVYSFVLLEKGLPPWESCYAKSKKL